MASTVVETRIKWASLLIGAGLLVQVLALLRVHPLSFVAFLVIGCPLVGLGDNSVPGSPDLARFHSRAREPKWPVAVELASLLGLGQVVCRQVGLGVPEDLQNRASVRDRKARVP